MQFLNDLFQRNILYLLLQDIYGVVFLDLRVSFLFDELIQLLVLLS